MKLKIYVLSAMSLVIFWAIPFFTLTSGLTKDNAFWGVAIAYFFSWTFTTLVTGYNIGNIALYESKYTKWYFIADAGTTLFFSNIKYLTYFCSFEV